MGGNLEADPERVGGRGVMAWEHFGILQEELESVAEEKDGWVSLLDLLPQ